jgi:hypothetical protein
MIMRFYTQQHRFYGGVDLHARTMYLCILDDQGRVVFDKNLPARANAFRAAVAPFRDGLVVAVECLFCWYWLADLCKTEKIAFVLGHALYMRAIHGGKSKNDQIDAGKIARLLKGGNLPQAYVYPAGMRETHDLLRPRKSLSTRNASGPTKEGRDNVLGTTGRIFSAAQHLSSGEGVVRRKKCWSKETDNALTPNTPARSGEPGAELGQPQTSANKEAARE